LCEFCSKGSGFKFIDEHIIDNFFNIIPFDIINKRENILEQANNSIRIGAKNFENKYANNKNFYKLQDLQRQLNEAIANEDYEKASNIKKEIEQLKEQGNV